MAPVQSKSGTATSGTSLTITLDSPTAAGNCLVVKFGSTANTTNPNLTGITIGGSAGNFARAVQKNTAGVANADIWTDQNCAGGQTSVVLTFSAGSGGGIGVGAWVEEWPGVVLSAAVDKTSSGSGNSTSWSSGSTGTLTQAAEIVSACVMAFASGISLTAPGSPWTELGTLTAGTSNRFAAGWQAVAATTAQTYSSTLSGSAPSWAAAVITLNAPVTVAAPDTGAAADAGSVAAAPGSAEAGSGADAVTISTAGAETGAAGDAGSLAAAVPGSDAASGTEAAAVSVVSPDTGSGAESGSATLGATDTETGHGTEAGAITGAAVTSGDTGTGAEAPAIAATAASGDTGSGADAVKVGVTGGDTGSAVSEQATQAPYVRPPAVLWNAPGKLSKSGGVMR